MKLGIPLLVAGVILLLGAIPYSIIGIITGYNQTQAGTVSGGLTAWLGLAGVVVGLIMTTVGAVRVFKR